LLITSSVVNSIEFHFILQNERKLNLTKLKLSNSYKDIQYLLLDTFSKKTFLSHDDSLYNHNISLGYNYIFLKNVPFIEFFKNNSIDVPVCFKKSYSLKRGKSKTINLDIVNYFFKKGLKSRVLNTWINIFNYLRFSQEYNSSALWRILYTKLHLNPIFSTRGFLYTNKSLVDNNLLWNKSTDLQSIFFKNLDQLNPLFLLYIYKVDKSIFKNSRGRSGKFTFIWKYISPYKRRYLVYYWLGRELKILNQKNFKTRLNTLITQVVFNIRSTWMYKIRKFSYNYVYYNCKHSLARTYRTVTR